MLSVFESLKSLLRLRPVVIDNAVFQLHYRWTVAILLAFSALVTLKQHWGEAIFCITNHKQRKVVETFCWIESTFTVPSAYNQTIGVVVPYPGITNSRDNDSDKKHHAYYQWVGLTLFFQAVMFCIPRFVWKSEEGGLIKNLVTGLKAVISNADNETKITNLICYLNSSWRTHDRYVTKYLLCEIANFVSVVLQLVLMEKFLGGEFSSFGMEMLRTKKDYQQTNFLFPGFRVFPRMTKCIFYDFGSSGDPQKYDALCLMPLNIIHEKIFVCIYLWFLMLAILSGVVIIVRLMSILQMEVREVALASPGTLCEKSVIRKVCEKCSFSDWFFLKLISRNVSPQNFRTIIHGITNKSQAGGPMDKRMQNASELNIETIF